MIEQSSSASFYLTVLLSNVSTFPQHMAYVNAPQTSI